MRCTPLHVGFQDEGYIAQIRCTSLHVDFKDEVFFCTNQSLHKQSVCGRMYAVTKWRAALPRLVFFMHSARTRTL
jgi:hypothetical protein